MAEYKSIEPMMKVTFNYTQTKLADGLKRGRLSVNQSLEQLSWSGEPPARKRSTDIICGNIKREKCIEILTTADQKILVGRILHLLKINFELAQKSKWNVLLWPTNSPDLKPIENVFDKKIYREK